MKFIILENWKELLSTQLTLLIARPRNFIRGPPCEGAETLFLYLSSFLKPQNPFNVSSAFYNCHSFLKIGNSIWGIRFLDLVNNACTSGKREHSVKSRESQQKSAAVHCASLKLGRLSHLLIIFVFKQKQKYSKKIKNLQQ